MSTKAIRAYQLARESRVEGRTIVDIAQRLGFPIGSPLATLDSHQRQAVEKVLKELPPDPPLELTGSPVPLEPRDPSLLARQALQLPKEDSPDPNS